MPLRIPAADGPRPEGASPAQNPPPAASAPDTASEAPALSLFARQARAYTAGRAGQQVTILNAGSTTAMDLGTDELAAGGADISVSLFDEDQPVTRAAVAARPGQGRPVLGDLRHLPLPPRTFDIVQCSSLLERVRHAELVLDRLVAAIKPGGLLLLRFRDRDSAAGFLDRVLPKIARRVIWRRRSPGQPGPYPAVYERLASARGVQAFVLMRGLVIAERLALGGLAGGLPPGPPSFLAAQKLVARLSWGRLTAAHEELLYVVRKPENRFARVL